LGKARFFGKKYYLVEVEIFFQKPEGLDLAGLVRWGGIATFVYLFFFGRYYSYPPKVEVEKMEDL
jgi:hypothetical protein